MDSTPSRSGPDVHMAELQALQQFNESGPALSMAKYVASSFWTSLTSEVQVIRDALEEDGVADESQECAPFESTPSSKPELFDVEYDPMICLPGRIYVMPGGFMEHTEGASSQILDAYLTNVEPILRLHHAPTLTASMRDGASYLGHPWDCLGNQALKRAIWMAGVNSMSEVECLNVIGEHKTEALDHHRRLTEISLAQADVVNTTDFATLQAFVTYLLNFLLMALRTQDHTRRVWTLLPMVVRIATALNLHRDPPDKCKYYSPFQRELRRRLWWRIRYLDVFSSMDRGSELLISADSCSVQIPTLTNDDLFDEHSTVVPELEGRDTDLSFSNVCYDACAVLEMLLRTESYPTSDTWEKRYQLALDFAARADQRYMRYFDKGTAFGNFRLAACETTKATIMLRAIRPMQQYFSSTPPLVNSPYVLRTAMENLRSSERINTSKSAERWKWQIWVQWHALAVALAGLCSIRNTPLAEETWYYVERQYEHSAKHVADSKNGMLWRPIEKLYKKASAFRDATPGQVHGFEAQRQQHAVAVLAPSHPILDARVTTTSTEPLPPSSPAFNSVYPTASNMSAPDNQAPGGWSFEPWTGAAQGFLHASENISSLTTDTSWLDWSQVMTEYANNDNLMSNIQPWPLLNLHDSGGGLM